MMPVSEVLVLCLTCPALWLLMFLFDALDD